MIFDNKYIEPYEDTFGSFKKDFLIEQLTKANETMLENIAIKIYELDENNYYLRKYIDGLENRIDKAIDYINDLDNCKNVYANGDRTITNDYIIKLLNILRGKDNE